ncbi:hypothetical protein JOB18_013508 [Solea senegalensis]|uniref:Uncharacterized protein n=1 Tax=Solea senegalensis TaxID=28829 RepID=A0AAV6QSW0_SOLSE|nr:hypothetical protein JOB18_013508 [Solea senegalensis]
MTILLASLSKCFDDAEQIVQVTPRRPTAHSNTEIRTNECFLKKRAQQSAEYNYDFKTAPYLLLEDGLHSGAVGGLIRFLEARKQRTILRGRIKKKNPTYFLTSHDTMTRAPQTHKRNDTHGSAEAEKRSERDSARAHRRCCLVAKRKRERKR